MKILNYAEFPQGTLLPKESQRCTVCTTKVKSLVGISLSFFHKAHRRQHFISAGFFMRTICAHLFNSLAELYPNYGGLIEGASARRDLVSGKANLDQSTTSKISLFGGGLKNYHKEASTMLTTPTPVTSKIYTFAIVGRRRTLLGFKKRIRYISAIGKTEQEARQTLSGLRLVFVSRTPINRKEVAW